jgi:hypothetical protein
MVNKAARQVCAGEGAGVAQEVGWGGRWEAHEHGGGARLCSTYAQRWSHPMMVWAPMPNGVH